MPYLGLGVVLVSLAAIVSSRTCVERCFYAGHCCDKDGSSCARPSCQMGCDFGVASQTVADCKSVCDKASGKCSFVLGTTVYQQCGDCSQRWLDPNNYSAIILPGEQPFWPPGFALPSCSSCGDVSQECYLGCELVFNSSYNPGPPSVSPPQPKPEPPAPWPNPTNEFNFSVLLSNHAVLQATPQSAAVFGITGVSGDATVNVTLIPSKGPEGSIYIQAQVSAGRWKAILPPQQPYHISGTTYEVVAACLTGGCAGKSATLSDVVFGDVWFGGGQSNFWLQLQYTYSYNLTMRQVSAGEYSNIRLMAGDSQVNGLSPDHPPVHPWRTLADAAALPPSNPDALAQYSAVSLHFAIALTDAYLQAGKVAPTIGLTATAIGGSMIEEWITNDVAEACFGFSPDANGAFLNHILWDNIVVPFSDMTVKGFLYYQGENNAGSLHGNSANKAGYGCLMPALIAAWRAIWSQTPDTTPADAPFGLVTLSTGDSEGAADIASFRWSQTGNYGVAPNPKMQNVFLAHAYDLADPWVNCGDAPQTKACPGCDTFSEEYNCLQPYYMGPGIHPRLKKPIGQRLAAACLPLVYGFSAPVAGPTISGCQVTTTSLKIFFNSTLLGGFPLVLQPYPAVNMSGLSVLIGATSTPGSGKWVPLNIELDQTSPGQINADLTPLSGALPTAVKYAWGDTQPNKDDVTCCPWEKSGFCSPGACPIGVTATWAPFKMLPANPFLALIVNGACECPSPQLCT